MNRREFLVSALAAAVVLPVAAMLPKVGFADGIYRLDEHGEWQRFSDGKPGYVIYEFKTPKNYDIVIPPDYLWVTT